MLGFSVSEVLASISPIPSGGLGTKQYDTYRQQVWNAFANQLVNPVNNFRNNGQLTYSGLVTYIDALQELVQSYVDGTNRFRQYISSNWLDPRFHDFYDPMASVLGTWQGELTTLPNDIISSIVENTTSMPLPDFSIPAIDSGPSPIWQDTSGDNQTLMPLDNVIDSGGANITQNTEGDNMLGFTTSDFGGSIGADIGGAIEAGIESGIGSIGMPQTGSQLTTKQYDIYRQKVWDTFANNLVNVVNSYRTSGGLTYSGLNSYIHAVEGLIDSFVVGTDKFRGHLQDSWLNPRFHDFYDPMVDILNAWKAELNTLPSDILSTIFGGGTGMPPPPVTTPTTGTGTTTTPVSTGQSVLQSVIGGNTLTYVAIGVGIYLIARKRK